MLIIITNDNTPIGISHEHTHTLTLSRLFRLNITDASTQLLCWEFPNEITNERKNGKWIK